MIDRFGPQSPARVVYYLRQICESLDEAHARGLVHRDIKPANVFVSRLGRQYDFVKLLDFGLVKRRHASDPKLTRLTIGEETRGTPGFMPPEMATGDRLDGRADIYSVGCLAYWLLTGQMVFEGRTLFEVVSHHLSTPPTPPSARTELSIPEALDAIVLECLAKDPGQRPANARLLSRRLATVPLGDRWSDERAESWWRSHLPEFVASDAAAAPAIGVNA
jgi:serine/threonine-protein kinase